MGDNMELRKRINGQPLSIEEEAERTVEKLLRKYYRRGYRDGRRSKAQELNPDIHYCRECVYWNGDKTSIGRRCTNNSRHKVGHRSTADYKVASQRACKSGFEPLPDPNQLRLEDIIQEEEGEKNENKQV